jgi:hypothetical protein
VPAQRRNLGSRARSRSRPASTRKSAVRGMSLGLASDERHRACQLRRGSPVPRRGLFAAKSGSISKCIEQAHSRQNFPCYRIMLTLLKSCTYADSMASAKSSGVRGHRQNTLINSKRAAAKRPKNKVFIPCYLHFFREEQARPVRIELRTQPGSAGSVAHQHARIFWIDGRRTRAAAKAPRRKRPSRFPRDRPLILLHWQINRGASS